MFFQYEIVDLQTCRSNDFIKQEQENTEVR